MLKQEQIQHLAQLARIELKPAEIEKYRKELSAILDYISKLEKADLSEIKEDTAEQKAGREQDHLREDKSESFKGANNLIKMAPASEGKLVKVGKVL